MGSGIFGGRGVRGESMSSFFLLAYLFSLPFPLRSMISDNEANRSPEDVTYRIDRLIRDIRTKYHAPVIGKPKHTTPPSDVLLVAHGHILRAFAMRWAGKTLQEGPTFLLEAGGVGTLSYEHHRIEEPAILLGGGFMVDVVEVCCLLGIGGCTSCSPLLLEIL
jgi:broad specificity phosphatase PhoE